MRNSNFSPNERSPNRKQLLFDRRYGWVYEEWADPIEVANIGGRGMFSLVPLTASTLDGTLHLANQAADIVVEALRNREVIFSQLQNNVKAFQNRTCHPMEGFGQIAGHHLKEFGEKTKLQLKVLGAKSSKNNQS